MKLGERLNLKEMGTEHLDVLLNNVNIICSIEKQKFFKI